jgi:hypothetical protein
VDFHYSVVVCDAVVTRVFIALTDCRRSRQGWIRGPHATAREPWLHAPAHKTGTQMFGSMHIGHHATGVSAFCPRASVGPEIQDLSTAGSLAMMAVTSEWNSCLA